ncbi:MAG: tetratricopeptide repeat protein [Oscillatoria sp. SIO1A7]|nr:tetratricopeptide repeat protein [Oscillatoria sp. SIO1A7]
MKLSLCTIAKNEQASLPRCLSSVKDLVDEIVLLDMGSTDRTPEIGQKFGAKVHDFQWCDDFAAARNEALKYVTGDWVLVLDANEAIAPEIVPQMKEAIHQRDFVLINLLRQELGAQAPYSLVSRLFRHHPDIRFEHPYHAMVDDSVARLLDREPERWQVGCLKPVAIWHQDSQNSVTAKKNKRQTARRVMAKYLGEHPNDAYTCSKLGALYVESGDLKQGMELLERALAVENVELPILYELHYHLGIAYSRRSKISRAKSHYQKALDVDILPQLKLGAYNNLGNLLLQTGDLSGAIAAYEMVARLDPHLAVARFNLGIALKEKGRIKEAIAAYRQAIELQPDYAEAYQNLGVTLLKAGNVLESLDNFRAAIALYEQRQSPAAKKLRQTLQEMGLKL